MKKFLKWFYKDQATKENHPKKSFKTELKYCTLTNALTNIMHKQTDEHTYNHVHKYLTSYTRVIISIRNVLSMQLFVKV